VVLPLSVPTNACAVRHGLLFWFLPRLPVIQRQAQDFCLRSAVAAQQHASLCCAVLQLSSLTGSRTRSLACLPPLAAAATVRCCLRRAWLLVTQAFRSCLWTPPAPDLTDLSLSTPSTRLRQRRIRIKQYSRALNSTFVAVRCDTS
jgi:hypothetical protein